MKGMAAEMSHENEWGVETCGCPMCGSDDASPTRYQQPPFAIQRCNACSLWFLSPRLSAEQAHRFYLSDTYFSGGESGSGYDDYSVQERSLRATFRKLLTALEIRGATGGALLEVGCGPGYLLNEARGQFDTLTGVELSAPAARRARRHTGAQVFSKIEDIEDKPAFDCIVATHVIEHIYDPVPFVERLVRCLKPEGHIILAAPHMGSPFRRVMGRRWPSFKYPEHVSFFDEITLPDLFRRAGLEVVEKVPYPHVFPLSLVLAKFGISGPKWTNSVDVTLPATTICFSARRRVEA